MNLLVTILFMATLGLGVLAALLFKQLVRVTDARDAAEARADANFRGDDGYAQRRQLTAENAGLKCELTEAHDQLEETQAENKKLRLELWQERKRIRDAKKALDEAASVEPVMSMVERAG